ncbi:MAG: fused MFS/spermidine synthase, partial [Caulobacterales bacterium]
LCANLLAFFVSALVCHQALVRARPSAGRLTEFYFFVSLGGVIGGGLVAFVAPLIFTDIYEYPLALAAVALFRPVRTVYFRTASNALGVASCVMALIALVLLQRQPAEIALFGGGVGAAAALIAAALPAYHGDGEKRQTAFLGIALIFAAGMIFLLFNPDILFTGLGGRDMRIAQPLGGVALISTLVVLAAIVQQSLQMRRDEPAAHAIGTDIAIGIALPVLVLLATLFVAGPRLTHDIVIAIGLGIAAIALFLNRDRPKLLAALILIAFAIVFIDQRSGTRLVHQERSFFGVLRIKEGPASNESGAPLLRILFHGTTIHGAQLEGAHDVERRPLTYYNPGTALGEATLAGLALSENRQLALIGLGTGTTACLTRSNDGLTIFEIDPAVARLSASTTGPFSYVRHCQPKAHIVLGDARLEIAKQRDAAFDVIVVDAFSSDAIPAHLLTREAVALYLRKTSADGIVVLHLSNRNLALVSEAVRVAHSLNAPYLWSVSNRITDNLAGAFAGLPASAMILAHDQETLDALQINRSEWRTLPTPAGRAWSDDYINLPRALWESMSGREECLQFEYKLRCETDGSK